MNTKDGVFRQRVGHLIEQHICKKFNLFYNKRQRTQGYYDAYDSKTIFEIKSSSINNNTFIIKKSNHYQLVDNKGSYIFVSYKLKNKDKDLSVISDIGIKSIRIIKGINVDILNKNSFKSKKTDIDKKSVRVYLSDIKNLECVDI